MSVACWYWLQPPGCSQNTTDAWYYTLSCQGKIFLWNAEYFRSELNGKKMRGRKNNTKLTQLSIKFLAPLQVMVMCYFFLFLTWQRWCWTFPCRPSPYMYVCLYISEQDKKINTFPSKFMCTWCFLYFEVPNPPVSTPHLSPFCHQNYRWNKMFLWFCWSSVPTAWLYFISVSGQK